MIRIKSEPASEDEDRAENVASNKYLEGLPESSNPQENLVVVNLFF